MTTTKGYLEQLLNCMMTKRNLDILHNTASVCLRMNITNTCD